MKSIVLNGNNLPGSALVKACTYAINLKGQLRHTFENGVTEIDNNRCEQGIRPIALGRKNWLHVGGPDAADPVAAVISVVETCKRTGINSRTYLAEVLPTLASANPDVRHLLAATLTPSRWLAAQSAGPA